MTLMAFPIMISTALGVSDGGLMGGLLLSFAIIITIALVMMSASHGKEFNMATMFVMVVTAGTLTAFGWFPLGLLIIGVVAAVALVIMRFIKG